MTNLNNRHDFEALFRSHYQELVVFARGYTQDDDQAEELVQETFVTLWKNAGQYAIQHSARSYLYAAVRNSCLNYLKHEKVKKAYGEHVRLFAPVGDSTDTLEITELRERIAVAIQKIPEKCREIFLLSRHEGKKYSEIAQQLQLSVKTVENQMGRALQILREELGDYLFLLFLWHCSGGVPGV